MSTLDNLLLGDDYDDSSEPTPITSYDINGSILYHYRFDNYYAIPDFLKNPGSKFYVFDDCLFELNPSQPLQIFTGKFEVVSVYNSTSVGGAATEICYSASSFTFPDNVTCNFSSLSKANYNSYASGSGGRPGIYSFIEDPLVLDFNSLARPDISQSFSLYESPFEVTKQYGVMVIQKETLAPFYCFSDTLANLSITQGGKLTDCYEPVKYTPSKIRFYEEFITFTFDQTLPENITKFQLKVVEDSILEQLLQMSGVAHLEAMNILDLSEGGNITVQRLLIPWLGYIDGCEKYSCDIDGDNINISFAGLAPPGTQQSSLESADVLLSLPLHTELEQDMVEALAADSSIGYFHFADSKDNALLAPEKFLGSTAKAARAQLLTAIQLIRRDLPEPMFLDTLLTHVSPNQVQGGEPFISLGLTELGPGFSGYRVRPASHHLGFVKMSYINPKHQVSGTSNLPVVTFPVPQTRAIQVTHVPFEDTDFDKLVGINTSEIYSKSGMKNATWVWWNKEFKTGFTDVEYDQENSSITIDGEVFENVSSPVLFGLDPTLVLKEFLMSPDLDLKSLETLAISNNDDAFLMFFAGPHIPVVRQLTLTDGKGKDLDPSATYPDTFLLALLSQATAYYRTNLVYGLRPGLGTAFYDTKNGGVSRSVLFNQWGLQQCENITIYDGNEAESIRTVEKALYVDPKSETGLTQAQLDSYCKKQPNCTDLIVAASCAVNGSLCMGLAIEDFNCKSLDKDDCYKNPFCTLTTELEDKVGIRLGNLVIVSEEEQGLDGSGGWKTYCRAFTRKVELNARNAEAFFQAGKLPLLNCEENCDVPPENFVGIRGRNSYNTNTTLANDFWINYFKNFPMFGASPLYQNQC